MIQNVEIRNFKSLKELSFSAKRVNVFVGKPNVGKSNILEALSLYCAGYTNGEEGFLKPFIRFNYVQELFYRKNIKNPIYVDTNLGAINLCFYNSDTYFLFIDPLKKMAKPDFSMSYSNLLETKTFFEKKYENEKFSPFQLRPLFQIFNNIINQQSVKNDQDVLFNSPIKRYVFKPLSNKPSTIHYPYSLLPPNGNNLVSILYNETKLLNFFAEIFKNEYNLELTIKDPEQVLEVVLREGAISYSTPINLTADTLQRMIFYLTAIKSNHGSVMLFEEPETHSFPPYTSMLADNIAKDKMNQYFLATHSPYLLRTLLDETDKDDIAIFVTTYKNHQTQLHQLSSEEIAELLEYNIDIFYNYKKFVD